MFRAKNEFCPRYRAENRRTGDTIEYCQRTSYEILLKKNAYHLDLFSFIHTPRVPAKSRDAHMQIKTERKVSLLLLPGFYGSDMIKRRSCVPFIQFLAGWKWYAVRPWRRLCFPFMARAGENDWRKRRRTERRRWNSTPLPWLDQGVFIANRKYG